MSGSGLTGLVLHKATAVTLGLLPNVAQWDETVTHMMPNVTLWEEAVTLIPTAIRLGAAQRNAKPWWTEQLATA